MAIHTARHGFIISDKNKKMEDIWSFSVPAWDTCPEDAPCRNKCYARKYTVRRRNIIESYQKNKDLIDKVVQMWGTDDESKWEEADRLEESYIQELSDYIRLYDIREFRWNVSGDIYHEVYLRIIIGVAKACPECRFWVFTKQYGILWNHLTKMGITLKTQEQFGHTELAIPENLTILISVWKDYRPTEESHLMELFPVVYVRTRDGEADVPEGAFECEGACRRCRKCMSVPKGECIVINEHN